MPMRKAPANNEEQPQARPIAGDARQTLRNRASGRGCWPPKMLEEYVLARVALWTILGGPESNVDSTIGAGTIEEVVKHGEQLSDVLDARSGALLGIWGTEVRPNKEAVDAGD